MLYAILTSLAVVAALVCLAAFVIGMVLGARMTTINVSRLLSTEVKALLPEGQPSKEEAMAQAVKSLESRFLKSMLVFAIALTFSAVVTVLRNLILTGNWLG